MTRRMVWLSAVAALLTQSACAKKEISIVKRTSPPLSDEDALLKHRFRGISGGELRVDAAQQEPGEKGPFAIYAPSGNLFNIGVGALSPSSSSVSGYGGSADGDRLVVPKYLRLMRYQPGTKYFTYGVKPPFAAYEGTPWLDKTIPVAERIPDEVLDRVRKYKGSLRLKFRLLPEDLLMGWEVRDGRSYPWTLDRSGNPYVPEADILKGGDFCEARPWHVIHPDNQLRMIYQKGWQIDKKTGQKIETDF